MRTLCLSAALALLAGCAAAPPKPPEPEATALAGVLTVTGQTLTSVTVLSRVAVANPGSTAWTITAAQYALEMGGKPVASGEPSFDRALAPGGSAIIDVTATAEIATDEPSLRALCAHGDAPLPLLLRGTVTLASGAARRILPFSVAGEMRAPRLPVARLNDAEIARCDGDNLGVTFYLGLSNQNDFPVKVKSITYSATLAGHSVGDGLASPGDVVPPSQLAEYEIDSTLDAGQGGREVAMLAASGKVDYVLDGVVDLGITRVPVHLTGALTFTPKKEHGRGERSRRRRRD